MAYEDPPRMGPLRPLSESLPPPLRHSAENSALCEAELIACQAWRRANLFSRQASETVFRDIMDTLGTGFVPDLFEGMSEKPAYLETAWKLFKEDLQLEQLDPKTKRMIALAISTDSTGNYCIIEYPRAFRLHALGHAICDRLLFTIRLFNAFDPYLSGVSPDYLPKATRIVSDCLREEYLSSGVTSPSQGSSCRTDNLPVASWIGGMLIISFLLLSITAGVYLLFQ